LDPPGRKKLEREVDLTILVLHDGTWAGRLSSHEGRQRDWQAALQRETL
jgi:hypothetical protein